MKQFSIPNQFVPGEYYTNDQIYYSLEIGNSGGIRPKLNSQKDLKFIVIITSSEEEKKQIRNPYADKIENGVLVYTGAGLKGDQEITGVNKRILEQIYNPVPILGFVKERANKYKFIGFLFLVRYYFDYQLDNEDNLRKVLIYEFQIKYDINSIKINNIVNTFAHLYEKFRENILPEDSMVDDFSTEKIIKNPLDKLELDLNLIKDIESMRKQMLSINPYTFEQLMGKLIKHVGFKNINVTKKSADGGIDISAVLEHYLSLSLDYQFQIKRWKHSVGRKEVANLRGSLGFNNMGVIISTSHFTSSALVEADQKGKFPINLIGMKKLYEIIKDSNFQIK